MLPLFIITLLINLAFAVGMAMTASDIRTKILSVNLCGTISSSLVAVISLVYEEPLFLDISLLYACVNFISVLAFMKFFFSGTKNA